MLNTLRSRIVIAAGLLFCSLSALALPTMIDFESFSDSESLTNQIAELTFSNATVLSAGISLNELDFPPHSVSNVIVDDGSPLSILFDAPARLVEGFFTYTANVTMRAFDVGNNLLASVTSLFESNLADIGDLGSSPNELLSITSLSGISRIEIQGDPAGLSFVLDDLSYLPAITDPDPTVPEPGTLALLLIAVLALMKYARPATKVNRTADQRMPAKRLSPVGALGLMLLLVAKMSGAQSIPPVSVSPTSATAGAATTVTATVAITDARLTSVNLIKIDAGGRSTNLGAMHDDGLNGDASSNDRTFTLRFTVMEASPTTISYKASAVLRGVLPRVTSAPLSFSIVLASSPPIALRAAGSGTCVLTASSGVKCWGQNNSGQLGIGTFVNTPLPTDVVGLSGGARALASQGKGYNNCVLTTAGGVKCSGSNQYGQVGNRTFVNSSTLQDVVGLTSGVSALTAAGDVACAVTIAGAAKCWGLNAGFVRPVTLANFSFNTPQDVVELSAGVSVVAPLGFQFCALLTSGGVKCLGQDPSQDALIFISGISSISVGELLTCVLTNANGVKCWGRNDTGQLGQGFVGVGSGVILDNNVSSFPTSTAPLDVISLTSGISAVSVGAFHVCALTTSGGVKCWGNNGFGQLGNGTAGNSNGAPQDVIGLASGVAAVSAGSGHSCALLTTGRLKCWGSNFSGQLGTGTFTNSPTPVDVVGF
jgi:Regulator of chromosome condensation (RCC1) repeat